MLFALHLVDSLPVVRSVAVCADSFSAENSAAIPGTLATRHAHFGVPLSPGDLL